MKRILCVLIIMVLSCGIFTGCEKSIPTNTTATKYGYFYFPNTNWGMTPKELFDALGKKESDFVLKEMQNPNELKELYYTTTVDFLGEKIEAKFGFSDLGKRENVTLFDVDIVYKNMDEKKLNKLFDKIEKMIKNQGIETLEPTMRGKEYQGLVYKCVSKNQVYNIPHDAYERLENYWNELTKSDSDLTPVSLPSTFYLSEVRVKVDNEERTQYVLNINGSSANLVNKANK